MMRVCVSESAWVRLMTRGNPGGCYSGPGTVLAHLRGMSIIWWAEQFGTSFGGDRVILVVNHRCSDVWKLKSYSSPRCFKFVDMRIAET